MAVLKPIFDEEVWMPFWLAETDTEQASETDSTQDNGVENPALNPPQNPFRTLMNKLRELMDTDNPDDLRQALYMVGDALTEGYFNSDQEHMILADSWLELHEMLKMYEPEATPARKMEFAANPRFMM